MPTKEVDIKPTGKPQSPKLCGSKLHRVSRMHTCSIGSLTPRLCGNGATNEFAHAASPAYAGVGGQPGCSLEGVQVLDGELWPLLSEAQQGVWHCVPVSVLLMCEHGGTTLHNDTHALIAHASPSGRAACPRPWIPLLQGKLNKRRTFDSSEVSVKYVDKNGQQRVWTQPCHCLTCLLISSISNAWKGQGPSCGSLPS